MTDTSEKIYWYLSRCPKDSFIKMNLLEKFLNIHKRGLQAYEKEPGLLDIARKEIWEAHKQVLITMTGPTGGVRLTNDIELIRHSKNQRAAHLWHEKRYVDDLDNILTQMEVGYE